MVSQVADLGDEAVTTDDRCTVTEYARNTATTNWLLTPVKRRNGWAGSCATAPTTSNQITGDTRYVYDAGADYTATPTKGQLRRTETISGFTGGTRSYVTQSTASYDAQGRPTDVADITGATTHTAYTPAAGGPTTKRVVTNALGWVTTTELNPARGLPTKVIDTSNGNRTTQTEYDAAGRTTKIWSPSRPQASFPAAPTRSYVYELFKADEVTVTRASVVTAKTLDANGGYQTSYRIYDGFARPRQTQRTAFGGQTPSEKIVADTFYDSAGRIGKTYAEHPMAGLPTGKLADGLSADADVPRWTRTIYDPVGRAANVVQMSHNTELWRTTTGYHGDHVDVTPPAGGAATTTYYDGGDRQTATRQYHGGTPAGTYDETVLTYKPAGSLATVKDAAGNTRSYDYDLRGRLITAVDPDRGSTTTTYNAKDQVETVTDAELRTVAYTYDTLGRRTTARNGTVTGAKRAEWTYDTPYKGATASSTRYTTNQDGTTNAYVQSLLTADAEYRPTQTRTTIPAVEGTLLAGTYSTTYSYRADGSPNTVNLPAAGDLAAETLTYGYAATYATPVELKSSYPGTAYLVNQATYTNLYEPGSINRSTALSGAGFVSSSRHYDENTGRVDRRLIGRSVGTAVLADAAISYDAIGNVLKIDDNAAGGRDTQCFQYDYLSRLTEAWTPASNACSALPASAAALGGPAAYWQSWTFDGAGNRKTQVDHTAAVTTSYLYPAAGAAHPHAVTSTTGTTTSGYSYDNAGNTTSRPGPNGQQTLAWDTEGRLATVSDPAGTSGYVYDADGNRLISRDATGTTVELGSTQLRLPRNGTQAVATRYYTFTGEVVAQRQGSGLRWLVTDEQGTALIAVTADSRQTLTQRRLTPYGEARGTAIPWVNPKGYRNGQADPTGLTHLGAREYDPGLGGFISADPAQRNAYQ